MDTQPSNKNPLQHESQWQFKLLKYVHIQILSYLNVIFSLVFMIYSTLAGDAGLLKEKSSLRLINKSQETLEFLLSLQSDVNVSTRQSSTSFPCPRLINEKLFIKQYKGTTNEAFRRPDRHVGLFFVFLRLINEKQERTFFHRATRQSMHAAGRQSLPLFIEAVSQSSDSLCMDLFTLLDRHIGLAVTSD